MRPSRQSLLLAGVLLTGFIVRLIQPSPGLLVTGDQAFLAGWSRRVADAEHLGISQQLFAAASSGDSEGMARAALQPPRGLVFALLYGLYENPEKVTRLVDVLVVALWQRWVSGAPESLEILGAIVSTAVIGVTYALGVVCLGSSPTALLAAALLAICPGPTQAARWLSWHAFGQLAFAAVILFALRNVTAAGEHRRRWLVAAGAAWGVSLYTNTLFPVLIPGVLLPHFWSISSADERTRLFRHMAPKILTYCCAGAVVFLPAACFIAARWHSFAERNLRGYAVLYGERSTTLQKLAATFAAPYIPQVAGRGLANFATPRTLNLTATWPIGSAVLPAAPGA